MHIRSSVVTCINEVGCILTFARGMFQTDQLYKGSKIFALYKPCIAKLFIKHT